MAWRDAAETLKSQKFCSAYDLHARDEVRLLGRTYIPRNRSALEYRSATVKILALYSIAEEMHSLCAITKNKNK